MTCKIQQTLFIKLTPFINYKYYGRDISKTFKEASASNRISSRQFASLDFISCVTQATLTLSPYVTCSTRGCSLSNLDNQPVMRISSKTQVY